ncbi:uncharacterized protein LAESUDRAFT_718816 [Laetiporus sulphureus 93-53]|uniref:HIT-type domain-containing protein n=1 Tax=Laetiporus sulphureus 93-53 TaxID=1314785 RepID=A0A165I3K2_9APHY|nr:uncharacterized protein LAESUDRAFT_718816 [Laetiporus sulphureus 93-53]KZT12549.1 hypothetical protein LAESUDRAFT_718816 [Laetiporus sulphureus 93-53]
MSAKDDPSPEEQATTSAVSLQSPFCAICSTKPAVYTCPRCSIRTCSLLCSTAHKTRDEGCSGVRNKAAYVPMNQYGYMALMSDYTFLEDVGRRVGDWGREIVQGRYTASTQEVGRVRATPMRSRGRGRGMRGGPAGGGKLRSKREVLKMSLDFRDIEMELLPNGMERRILNQSTWDFKNRTALLTVEFRFHPPRDPLAPSSQASSPPFTLLTHRNALEKSLLSLLQDQMNERGKSKKADPLPSWIHSLVFPDVDVPDAFMPPTCVMRTPLDPLSSLKTRTGYGAPRPGHIICEGYYKLDPSQSLGANLKHKNFVEFPTIEVWEDGIFHGTIVDHQGIVLHGDEEPQPKRRKLSAKAGKKAITGLLTGYGSDDEDGREKEEQNVLDLLGGYAGSDDDADTQREPNSGPPGNANTLGDDEAYDDGLCDEDAEGETDDEFQAEPEDIATLLEQLRQAGALRDPRAASALPGFADGDDEEVDWGDSSEEEQNDDG